MKPFDDSSSIRSRWDRLIDWAVVIVMITTGISAGIMVRRELLTPSRPSRSPATPVPVANWNEVSSSGHRIGPVNAAITIVVFADFECPACQVFARSTFPQFAAKHPGKIALLYRHWPLEQHRFAYAAARASECASEQGEFKAMHDSLYAHQRDFGLTPFAKIAQLAGIKNIAAFEKCASDKRPVPLIDKDVDAVTKLGGTGTPTVVVNGWLYKDGISLAALDSIARTALSRTLTP